MLDLLRGKQGVAERERAGVGKPLILRGEEAEEMIESMTGSRPGDITFSIDEFDKLKEDEEWFGFLAQLEFFIGPRGKVVIRAPMPPNAQLITVQQFVRRGAYWLVAGEFDRARADFESALKIDPDDETAQAGLRYIKRKGGVKG